MIRILSLSGFAAISLISFSQMAVAECISEVRLVDMGDDGAPVFVPKTFVECGGLVREPLVLEDAKFDLNIEAGTVFDTTGTAITFEGPLGEVNYVDEITSDEGDGIVVEGAGGEFYTGLIPKITAAGDGIRVNDGSVSGWLWEFDVGGTGVNLGEDGGQSYFSVGTGRAGEHGVFAGGDGAYVVAFTQEDEPGQLVTGNDSFNLGANSNVTVTSGSGYASGLNDVGYEVRATGPGASVASLESGFVHTIGVETRLIAEDGPAVRIRGTGLQAVQLEGVTQGTTGVVFEQDAGDASSVVSLLGTLVGTGGVAAELSDGDNLFFLSSFEGQSAFIDGDVLLKGGDDTFTFLEDVFTDNSGCGGDEAGDAGAADCEPVERVFTFDPTSEFLAYGSVIDGGDGFDTVELPVLSSLAIVSAILNAPDDVTLTLQWPQVQTTARFLNFESFEFSDRTMTMADFGAVTAVPLPAPALMLGAAVLGLGGFSRRTGGAGARRG